MHCILILEDFKGVLPLNATEEIFKLLPSSTPHTFILHVQQSQARLYIRTSVSSLEQTWTSPPASSEPRTDFQRSVFLAWPSLGSLRKNRPVRTAALTDSLKLVQRSLTTASLTIQLTFNSITAGARTKGTQRTAI